MKGTLKALQRAPQAFGSRVGMASKSQDADFNELNRKFTALEDYTVKLIKDCSVFRDAVAAMLTSQAGFGVAFATIFQPIAGEASLSAKHPESASTIKQIASYQDLMSELRDAVQPELELIDARVVAPLKEYGDLLKKVRKTITKRDHKLIDFDRYNNSYGKLKDKKEKSLSDEKNLFKLEQDLEQATQEYDHYNNSLKTELPHLLALTTAFVAPLFQTFYFVKVGILYTLLEKMKGFQGATFGELPIEHIMEMHADRLGDTPQQIEELTIVKRFVGTARMMSQHRQSLPDNASVASASSSGSGYQSIRRTPSATSAYVPTGSKSRLPPPVADTYEEPAPPPYIAPGAATGAKRAPPPPPGAKPRLPPAIPKPKIFVTALYDYEAQAAGDLSFSTGDRIELVKKTDSAEDWWTGKANGNEGVFPGNYVQL